MLEWICPQCDREVDPAFQVCPFCGGRERPAMKPRRSRRGISWEAVDRGFSFGLGFVAVLALTYFLLFLAAYLWHHERWLSWLTDWLYGR